MRGCMLRTALQWRRSRTWPRPCGSWAKVPKSPCYSAKGSHTLGQCLSTLAIPSMPPRGGGEEVHDESRPALRSDAITTGCPDNPTHTVVARAALGGRSFGGPASTPDGEVRDMVALIGIVPASDTPDPSDVFQAQSSVFYCASKFCTADTQLHRQDLGPVKRGDMARLRVQWDRTRSQFIFQRDGQPEVFARYAVPSDILAPLIPMKLLQAVHFVPACTATPRPMSYMDALFGDVMVNELIPLLAYGPTCESWPG